MAFLVARLCVTGVTAASFAILLRVLQPGKHCGCVSRPCAAWARDWRVVGLGAGPPPVLPGPIAWPFRVRSAECGVRNVEWGVFEGQTRCRMGSTPRHAPHATPGVAGKGCGCLAFPARPGGEIGRHAVLRGQCRKASRFESGPGHPPLSCLHHGLGLSSRRTPYVCIGRGFQCRHGRRDGASGKEPRDGVFGEARRVLLHHH
jgi:hypothetical protein